MTRDPYDKTVYVTQNNHHFRHSAQQKGFHFSPSKQQQKKSAVHASNRNQPSHMKFRSNPSYIPLKSR
ncbi:hypothetical protein Hanom_Chr15g01347161 [Helianthus anomalus]